jgi:hypothetical protein
LGIDYTVPKKVGKMICFFDSYTVLQPKSLGGCFSKPPGSGAAKVFSLSVLSRNGAKRESSFPPSSFFP